MAEHMKEPLSAEKRLDWFGVRNEHGQLLAEHYVRATRELHVSPAQAQWYYDARDFRGADWLGRWMEQNVDAWGAGRGEVGH